MELFGKLSNVLRTPKLNIRKENLPHILHTVYIVHRYIASMDLSQIPEAQRHKIVQHIEEKQVCPIGTLNK